MADATASRAGSRCRTPSAASSRYIHERAAAKAKAVEYLAGAPDRRRGRGAARFVLLAMAIYADENAVANSNRAFHQATIERAVPWADDDVDIDLDGHHCRGTAASPTRNCSVSSAPK